MSYFPVEDFVGNGALKGILPKLLEEGWDNVRNLKLMKSEDMDAINMTQQQKDALEMRSYLHDRALMQYGDKLEDSRKSLAKLLELSNDDLSAQFGMKRGHIASFLEKRISWCPLQAPHSLPSTQKTTSPRYNYIINNASKMDPKLYRGAMGDKEKMGGEEKPELVPQISWSSRLFSWINWSNGRDTESSKQKMRGKENEDNDDDVLNLMQCINDQQLQLPFTSNKNTILHVAAQFGNQKYVKIILEKSPLPSLLRCLNIDDETPLHIAAREGHLDIVEALIECAKKLDHEEIESGGGATKEMLRATNKDNDTALHMAVRNRHSGVVKLLTKEDHEFTHPPNNAKETPLYLAAKRQYNDMVSIIWKYCTSPAYGGPKGQTALHAAASDLFEIESTKLLLDWKPDLIKETDEYGYIPLHYAARYGNKDHVKLMLEKDTSVAYITTGKEGDEKTALHIAAARGNVDIMEKLLLYCPDCWEMVNSKGQNVLHIAVDMERVRVIEYILKKPWIICLINQKDIEGNTPLHLVATIFWGNRGTHWDKLWNELRMKLWFECSGDREARNNKNETPRDIYMKEFNSLVGSGGRNIVIPDQELARKKWKEESKKMGAQYRERRKERRKAWNEEMKKMGDTHMVVATLIATITFAAGFTMPGGYNSNEGSNQGMPLLLREAAFKVFVITNTIAVICSTSSVFLYVTTSLYYVGDEDDVDKTMKRYFTALLLILIAVAAMIVAFITGSFAVFAHSLGLAISVCLIGCISFLIYFIELKSFFQNLSNKVEEKKYIF